MRNFLLAASAILGVSTGLAGLADAQTTTTTTPTFAFPSVTESAAGNGPAVPGTITVRLRARMWFDAGVGTDSLQKVTTSAGTTKLTQGVYFGEFARLYPGFDGVAANGLQYGASLEVRQNSGASGPASGSPTLYWRRETGYVGMPKLGKLYFGQTDAAIGRFMTGTMESFDYNGGWNGDAPGFLTNGSQLSWTFPEDGGFYTPTKIVYVSPSFSGFDFGVSFEPNNQVSSDGICATPQSGTASLTGTGGAFNGCGTLASVPGGSGQRRNLYDGVGRYTGAFGPVGLTATVGYIGSGHVLNSTATPGYADYKGLGVIDSGVVLTYGGFAVGGHVTAGQIAANGGLIRSGQKDGFNWISGVSYTVGPLIVGFHYLDEQSAGKQVNGPSAQATSGIGQLRERGVAAGLAYDYAPGATFIVSGLWGHRQETGVDLTGNISGTTPIHNKTDGRALQIGNVFRW